MTSYTTRTPTYWILVTDGRVRLAFNSESKAREYASKTLGFIPEGTTVQKVYGETEIVEVVAQ